MIKYNTMGEYRRCGEEINKGLRCEKCRKEVDEEIVEKIVRRPFKYYFKNYIKKGKKVL